MSAARYQTMAEQHWKTHLPERYQAIPPVSRQSFFQSLARQAQEEVRTLQDQIAGPDPEGEGYLEKIGRLNAARQQAEEIVLPQTILPASEDLIEQEAGEPDLPLHDRMAALNRDWRQLLEDR